MAPKMTAVEAARHVVFCASPAELEYLRKGDTALFLSLRDWDDSEWTDDDFVAFSDEAQRLANIGQ